MKILQYLLFLFLISCSNAPYQQETEQFPNILFIIADDHGYADISCANIIKGVSTPGLDQLAARSIRFTQAYATSPICSPSRGGMITGTYQQRQGVFWYGGPGLNDPNIKTLPEVLKTKNYVTAHIGKVHYGGHDSDTTHRSFPLNHGFDYFYGFTTPRKHYLLHQDGLEATFQQSKKTHKRKGQSLRQGALWDMTEKRDTLAFATQLFGNKARDFIVTNKDQPFFLQLSFNAVHNFTHQLPSSYLQKNNLNGYKDWNPAEEEYYDWYQKGRAPNNPEGRAHYLGQLHFLDQEVGRMIQFLEEEKLLDNTIVIYIGDNGGSTPIYANNSPLKGSKYTLYEGGIRVPLMISFPKKYTGGIVNNEVVSAMDLFPTICQAAGISPPDHVDGKDITPLLNGQSLTQKHHALVWDTMVETAVRQGKWKWRAAISKGHADYEMVELELGEFLYNLDEDPGETINLAEKFPDKLLELKSIHQDWLVEMNNH